MAANAPGISAQVQGPNESNDRLAVPARVLRGACYHSSISVYTRGRGRDFFGECAYGSSCFEQAGGIIQIAYVL